MSLYSLSLLLTTLPNFVVQAENKRMLKNIADEIFMEVCKDNFFWQINKNLRLPSDNVVNNITNMLKLLPAKLLFVKLVEICSEQFTREKNLLFTFSFTIGWI